MGAGASQRTVDALVIDGASGLQNQRLIHGHRDVVLDADGRDSKPVDDDTALGLVSARRRAERARGSHDGHDF